MPQALFHLLIYKKNISFVLKTISKHFLKIRTVLFTVLFHYLLCGSRSKPPLISGAENQSLCIHLPAPTTGPLTPPVIVKHVQIKQMESSKSQSAPLAFGSKPVHLGLLVDSKRPIPYSQVHPFEQGFCRELQSLNKSIIPYILIIIWINLRCY